MINSNNYKTIAFADHPEFTPNLTPREMFRLGSFGGTYWREIKSGVTGKRYQNQHLKYPVSWWRGISDDKLTSDEYNKDVNQYKVKVGTSLEYWESKDWITKHHPYGWVQWYCDFYIGIRGPDDERQIKRWQRIAGPNGRFRLMLINMIKNKGKRYNDRSVSPKIRQTLQHWGVMI